MIKRLVYISPAQLWQGGLSEVEYQLWLATRDMDTVLDVVPLARTKDGRGFLVTGIPR